MDTRHISISIQAFVGFGEPVREGIARFGRTLPPLPVQSVADELNA